MFNSLKSKPLSSLSLNDKQSTRSDFQTVPHFTGKSKTVG